jgi:hypothetical protein
VLDPIFSIILCYSGLSKKNYGYFSYNCFMHIYENPAYIDFCVRNKIERWNIKMTNYNEMIIKNENKNVANGYKVIKVNVSNSVESLYAVCTPIQKQ